MADEQEVEKAKDTPEAKAKYNKGGAEGRVVSGWEPGMVEPGTRRQRQDERQGLGQRKRSEHKKGQRPKMWLQLDHYGAPCCWMR